MAAPVHLEGGPDGPATDAPRPQRTGPTDLPTDRAADRLRLALEAGELGTWRWDRATGVTEWDAPMERLFGLEPGTFDGTFDAWVAGLHPDEVDAVLGVVQDAVERKGSYQLDHRAVWPDGSVHWIQGRGTVTLDDDGHVTGTIGCAADITARKRAQFEAEERARIATDVANRERLARQRLEFLVTLSDTALRAASHTEFMEAVTRAAVPTLGDWCALHFQPGADKPEVAVAHVDPARVAWAQDLAGRYPYDPDAPTGVPAVIRTGVREFHARIGPDLLEEALAGSPVPESEREEIVRRLGLTSSVIVPLRTRRGVIGAMTFVSAESGRTYDDADVALAEAAAGRVGAALESLWVADGDREVATKLQRALLPISLPHIPGVSVTARYWPAGVNAVGGDFYDVFPIGDDGWAVLIGDVCGKGADAAAVTSVIRHTTRAAAVHGQTPEEVVRWMNDAMHLSGRGLFCTALYAMVRLARGGVELVLASAGHPPALVVRRDGRIEALGGAGTLLGVLPSVQRATATCTLAPGDTVVLHTDGLSDVPPPYGSEQHEVEALVAGAVADVAGRPTLIADRVYERFAERVPERFRTDDVAVVVLHVEDPAAPGR